MVGARRLECTFGDEHNQDKDVDSKHQPNHVTCIQPPHNADPQSTEPQITESTKTRPSKTKDQRPSKTKDLHIPRAKDNKGHWLRGNVTFFVNKFDDNVNLTRLFLKYIGIPQEIRGFISRQRNTETES